MQNASPNMAPFKTFPIHCGWITAIGDFRADDAIRSLYLAWTMVMRVREVADATKAIAESHFSLSTTIVRLYPDLCGPDGTNDRTITDLVMRRQALLAEIELLRQAFTASGYDAIRWDGRLGPNLLPFEGIGLDGATWIVMRLARVLDVANLPTAPVACDPDSTALQAFAKAISMKRPY